MININYDIQVSINESMLTWQKDEFLNCYKKIFSQDEDKQTLLLKLDKNATFKNSNKINSVEIYVLEGVYENEFGSFSKGTYLKLPQENESKISSKEGCVVFKKINYLQNTKETSIVNTEKEPWLQGQGNLSVKPLSDQTALVHWPKDEVFTPHTHGGGEEIFVLKGVFMDEHGSFEKGTWIRSPHLSRHYPFVKEETIIFVKTGHM